jgi:hypothetical protein
MISLELTYPTTFDLSLRYTGIKLYYLPEMECIISWLMTAYSYSIKLASIGTIASFRVLFLWFITWLINSISSCSKKFYIATGLPFFCR